MTITYSAPADLRWLNDITCWRVLTPFIIRWVPAAPYTSISFEVPRGFVTDLASLPGFVRAFNPVNGHHLQPAVVHDYVYRNTDLGVTKEEGDRMFYDGMIAMGTPEYRAWYMYRGVKIFGGSSYADR